MCVLIVEDEPIILMTTAAWLEAVDLLEMHPGYFSALVTDFHMPLGMTGAHLVMHMRKRYPTIPMIIATAITYVVTEGWRLQYGVDMLAKPYDPEALVSMLRAGLTG